MLRRFLTTRSRKVSSASSAWKLSIPSCSVTSPVPPLKHHLQTSDYTTEEEGTDSWFIGLSVENTESQNKMQAAAPEELWHESISMDDESPVSINNSKLLMQTKKRQFKKLPKPVEKLRRGNWKKMQHPSQREGKTLASEGQDKTLRFTGNIKYPPNPQSNETTPLILPRATDVNTTPDPVQTGFLDNRCFFSLPSRKNGWKSTQSHSSISVNGLRGLPHSFLMNPVLSAVSNGPCVRFNPEVMKIDLKKKKKRRRREGWIRGNREA